MEQDSTAEHALVAAFLRSARESPDHAWAHTQDGPRSRGASAERILTAGASLRANGPPAGALVGLVMPPVPDAVEALAALWCAGLVPILIDPSLPQDAARESARRLGARLFWCPEPGRDATLDPARAEPLEPDPVAPGAAHTPSAHPDAAAVKLTSGSSGAPQGVEVSAAALLADTEALVSCIGLSAGDRGLVAVPLSHSYGFSVLTLPALTHGLELVFPGDAGVRAAARSMQATFLPSVPAWFHSVLRGEGQLAPSLRTLVSAGAPLSADLARGFRQRFGVPIHVLYGASECGSITYDREGGAAERGRVGTLLDGVRVELEGGSEDEPGLVSVHSPALGLGYLPRGSAGDRLAHGRFLSEDLARWREGELELCGRRSEWISVKGHKVDPREVAARIEAHPRVREAAVIAKPRAGQTEETVRAVIACEGELSYLEIVEWCRASLAPHKLPRSVVFVRELPRNERGKLDRTRLRAL